MIKTTSGPQDKLQLLNQQNFIKFVVFLRV